MKRIHCWVNESIFINVVEHLNPNDIFSSRLLCVCILGLLLAACQPVSTPGAVQPVLPVSGASSSPKPLPQSSSQPLVVNSPSPTVAISVVPLPSGNPSSPLPALLPSASPSPIASVGNNTWGSSSSGGGGAGGQPVAQATVPPNGQPVLDDLRLVNGGSVLGADAADAIIPNFHGKVVRLEASGYFFVGAGDPVRLVMDNGIVWEVTSISQTRIEARLETAYIADLYLTGPHKFVLELPLATLQYQVRVGTPELELFLQPEILSVTVVRNESQTPVQLEVKGRQLMLNPNFAQVKINGEIVSVLETAAASDGSQTLQVALPSDVSVFAENNHHVLSYQTPMGLTVHYFN